MQVLFDIFILHFILDIFSGILFDISPFFGAPGKILRGGEVGIEWLWPGPRPDYHGRDSMEAGARRVGVGCQHVGSPCRTIRLDEFRMCFNKLNRMIMLGWVMLSMF